MDYEKKYKELVNAARELQKANPSDEGIWNWVNDNFPEIAESEDEKIRKALIEFFGEQCDMSDWNGVYGYQVLAWLEKQGVQKASYTTIVETGDGGINALVTKELPTDGCDDEQKPADMLEPKDYSSIDPHFFKPADKVEPKFKIEKGKWYVCIRDLLDNYANKAFHKGDTYLSTQDGSLIPSNSNVPFEVVCPDTYFRNWDISDAKDGDVLASNRGDIIIAKKVYKGQPHAYCGINNLEFMFSDSKTFWHEACYQPATKEQRDLLFQKMKEAGFEWDADKKELKKKSQRMISAEAKEVLYGKPAWRPSEDCNTH